MSGIEYYTITGFLKTSGDYNRDGTSTLSDLTFPTSPMYLDKERYSGRNMVWLKSFNAGGEMVRDLKRLQIKRVLEGISPSLILTLPSLNSFGVGAPTREGQTPLKDQALGYCFTAGAKENTTFQATSLETLRHMVGSGMGITLLPALATHHQAQENICYRPFNTPSPFRKIALVIRPNYARMECIRTLVSSIRKAMKDVSM